MNLIAVGISTGSNDIETWHFDDEELCKKFCERLVKNTGRSVWVIEGKKIGKYPKIFEQIKKQLTCQLDQQQCQDSCEYKGHREDCPFTEQNK